MCQLLLMDNKDNGLVIHVSAPLHSGVAILGICESIR